MQKSKNANNVGFLPFLNVYYYLLLTTFYLNIVDLFSDLKKNEDTKGADGI